MTKEEQTLIYYYEPVYTGLIENHIDDRTGKVLYTEEHQIQVGTEYNIPSKEFAGYDLVESKLPANAEGIMGEELVTVNYYYIKKAVLEVNYIDIYTNKFESKDWILQNDLYFNLNTGNEEMSQKEIDLIWQIDEAKLTPDKHIETKYGLGTIRNLSSGCKTLINIVKHPDKVVNVEECGPNVLKIIFAMENIKIYMSRPTLFDIPDNAKIRFNNSDIVTGGRGYNAWWSKEYERREADDL